MRLLLDTHAFLWFVDDSRELSTRARAIIEDAHNDVLVSVASIWEVALKTSLGRLELSAPFESFMVEQLRRNRMTLLSITIGHVAGLVALPFHHRDPFDRLLVAQAIAEVVPIISRDSQFDEYGVERIW